MPVSWSITASLRCWMSERISGVESTATHSSSATGAITSTGSSMTSWALTPKATASRMTMLMITPTTTPRIGNRELSVITGMASHESVGCLAPPLSATAPPITKPLPTHAPNISSSGFSRAASAYRRARSRAQRGSRRAPATSRATGPRRRVRREDRQRPLAHRTNALLHVEHPFAVEFVATEPGCAAWPCFVDCPRSVFIKPVLDVPERLDYELIEPWTNVVSAQPLQSSAQAAEPGESPAVCGRVAAA